MVSASGQLVFIDDLISPDSERSCRLVGRSDHYPVLTRTVSHVSHTITPTRGAHGAGYLDLYTRSVQSASIRFRPGHLPDQTCTGVFPSSSTGIEFGVRRPRGWW